jgi:hypothetical protein
MIVAAITSSVSRAQWTVLFVESPGSTSANVFGAGGGLVAGADFGQGLPARAVLWSIDLGRRVELAADGFVVSTDGVQHVGQRSGSDATLWTGTSGSFVNLGAGVYLRDVDAGIQVGDSSFQAHAWTGSAASAVSLHPTGADQSSALAVHAGTIGGWFSDASFGPWHACIWPGLAPSPVIDLRPSGLLVSRVEALDALSQVGWTKATGGPSAVAHAALWHGSAASWVDLHPPLATESYAWDVSGPFQVGQVRFGTTGLLHAALWTGTAASFVDLSDFLPRGLVWSHAQGVWTDSSGTTFVAGAAQVTPPYATLAIWRSTTSSDVVCDGSGAGTSCPCGNAGGPGNGCANSASTHGAHLARFGTPSVASDSLVLLATGMPNELSVYYQGTLGVNGDAGTVFGDGLMCAGGQVMRFAVRTNRLFASRYPESGDARISAVGQIPAAGATRTYQVWYRDANGPCGTGHNQTNGLRVTWVP